MALALALPNDKWKTMQTTMTVTTVTTELVKWNCGFHNNCVCTSEIQYNNIWYKKNITTVTADDENRWQAILPD